jgi:hypothetical protein
MTSAPSFSLVEALKKLPPVNLGLAPRYAPSEGMPLSVCGYPDGGENRTGQNGPAVADLFVTGVENEVGDLAEGPVPPSGRLPDEFGSGPTDLGGRDGEANNSSTIVLTLRLLTPWT